VFRRGIAFYLIAYPRAFKIDAGGMQHFVDNRIEVIDNGISLKGVPVWVKERSWTVPENPEDHRIIPNGDYLYVNQNGEVKAWLDIGYDDTLFNVPMNKPFAALLRLTTSEINIQIDNNVIKTFSQVLSAGSAEGMMWKNYEEWGGSNSLPREYVSSDAPYVIQQFVSQKFKLVQTEYWNGLNNPPSSVHPLKSLLVYATNSSAVYLYQWPLPGNLNVEGGADETHAAVKITLQNNQTLKIEVAKIGAWPIDIMIGNETLFNFKLSTKSEEPRFWWTTIKI
jgi:hypothetical protein